MLWGLLQCESLRTGCFTKLCSGPKGSLSLWITVGQGLLLSGLSSYVSQDSFGCK